MEVKRSHVMDTTRSFQFDDIETYLIAEALGIAAMMAENQAAGRTRRNGYKNISDRMQKLATRILDGRTTEDLDLGQLS